MVHGSGEKAELGGWVGCDAEVSRGLGKTYPDKRSAELGRGFSTA